MYIRKQVYWIIKHVHMCACLLGIHVVVEFEGHKAWVQSVLIDTDSFPKWLYTSPHTVNTNSMWSSFAFAVLLSVLKSVAIWVGIW